MVDEAELPQTLLRYLRDEIDASELSYAAEPSRIMGGRDTRIYAFALAGAPDPWSGALILRLFRDGDPPERAVRDSVVQSTVWSLGFPAPRVVHTCVDPTILGAPFMVMERLAGRDLITERGIFGLAATLVEVHTGLHALDPSPLAAAMDAAGLSVPDPLDDLRQRLDADNLDALRPGLEWLVGRRPSADASVICHGDFHPENVLANEGAVTGVIDWDLATIAPAEFDVGNTRALLRMAEPSFGGVRAGIARTLQPLLTWGYTRRYAERHPLDHDAVKYWEAYRCLRSLAVTLGGRWSGDEGAGRPPWDATRLARCFEKLTGVAVHIRGGA